MSSLAVVQGSLGAVAKRDGVSVAEAFLSCEIVAIVDTSGSMDMRDARGGRQRYQVACEELAQLQATHPGQVGVIAFSDQAVFCPGGVPEYFGSSTNLAGALKFASVVDGTVRFVVISDGIPDSEDQALRVASTMTSEISTIFVGPESDRRGPEFLARLARSRKGQFMTATAADLLGQKVESLLLRAG